MIKWKDECNFFNLLFFWIQLFPFFAGFLNNKTDESLALDLKTLVSLLGHGQLDAVASGQGDVGLGAFADDEDVREPGGEGVTVGILNKTKTLLKVTF